MSKNAKCCGEQQQRAQEQNVGSKGDSLAQEAVLIFDFDAVGRCTLSTRWGFPLTEPGITIGVFNESAFGIPGGQTIVVDLLYALENEFPNWHHQRIPADGLVGNGTFRVYEDSITFRVSKLESSKQLHLANGLFIEAAAALVKLWEDADATGGPISNDGSVPMPYAVHGGLQQSRDYRELVHEILSGLTDCEIRTLARIMGGKSVSEISEEDGVSRAAVRSRVLNAIKHNEYWEISSRLGMLRKRVNQHAQR